MHFRDQSSPLYFFVERYRENQAYDMPGGHMHTWNELYYLIEGERRYFIDGQIYTVHAGDVIFIPKGTMHHTTSISDNPHERYLVEFGDGYIPESLRIRADECFGIRHFTLSHEERGEFLHLLQKAETECASEDSLANVLFHTYMAELLIMLIRRLNTGIQTHTRPRTPTERLIESATEYIVAHLQNNLTLTHVADTFHLSHAYFSRIFKAYTGFGFNEYLTQLRVHRAANLLNNTGVSVSEIAHLCGFADSNYFSSVFKKTMGISPKKYRMQK